MLHANSLVPLVAAVLGQFAAYLLSGTLEAYAVPCCSDPSPMLPAWYGFIVTPIHFLVMLVPAFLCGFFVVSRPIVTGAISAGAGSLLWHLLGAHIIASLFPERAVSGIGQFQSVFWSLTSFTFLVTLAVTAACYAAAGASAASGGFLLRRHAP
jgi:hypothetical protein